MDGRSVRKRGAFAAAAVIACLALFGGTEARALDYNDVKNLLVNQVPEQTIVNMLRQSGTMTITESQAAELRSMGATESLLAAMPRRTETTTAAPQEQWSYVDSDGTVYSSEQAPPTIVAEPSIASPGKVIESYPSTTYMDPNVTYYDSDGSVIVTSPPTVVYESPTYVEVPTYVYPEHYYPSSPSWSFSFGFGNSHRYRGGRPYHGRPPAWRPRPGGGRPGYHGRRPRR